MRQGHFHLHVSPGPKGTGADHAQYIAREGRFKAEKYGEIGEHEVGNLPEWARGSAARFFARADDHERSNGNSYREFEMSLPIDLSHADRVKLVREFVAEQLGDRFAYSWAIHEPNGHNPHVHIMFSERTLDGIERGPEQYFKRANTKHPERGGHLKSDWFTGRGGPEAIEALRERWAQVQNHEFERLGLDVRVDHRSLEAQGIDREPGRHRGPAVSGIEARGEVADVSVRREAERIERAQARAAVEAEARVVTREEMAIERVAVRERRELAQEVTGEDRAAVLKRVEADRVEQIQRAQAAAERRVERRQGMGIGGRLLDQARHLRERIGQQLGRVKDWVRERFPDPIGRLKERSRDVFDTVVEKAQRALGRDAGEGPAADKTVTPKREMSDGLQFGAGSRGVAAPSLSTPATPAATVPMSLAEQLELRSNAVAERLDREAHPQRDREIEGAALQRQPGHDAPGRQPSSADGSMMLDDRRPAGYADERGGGEVASQRLQPSEGAKELSLAEQLQARADEVSRRVEQELVQERAVRAEVERQRVLDEAEEQKRGRTRNRGRVLGDDDEFTRGRGR